MFYANNFAKSDSNISANHKKKNVIQELNFYSYMCIVFLSVRPTKRVKKKNRNPKRTKSAGSFTTSHFHKPLSSCYNITADMITVHSLSVYMRLNSTKNFVDFEVKLFRGCNGVRCLLGMVYIVSLDIHIHCVCIHGKKRGMWSKGKILE